MKYLEFSEIILPHIHYTFFSNFWVTGSLQKSQ